MEPKETGRLQGVLNAARVVSRFCERTVGWNRIGLLLSIAIIAIAVVVLYNILRDIEIREVVQALKRTDRRDIIVAALCVAGGYFTLTFYDLFALRTVGH